MQLILRLVRLVGVYENEMTKEVRSRKKSENIDLSYVKCVATENRMGRNTHLPIEWKQLTMYATQLCWHLMYISIHCLPFDKQTF